MNKKILGLFLIFGIVASPAQAAAFNNQLNIALARQVAADAAEGRRNAAQANIIAPAPADHQAIVDQEPVIDHAPLAGEDVDVTTETTIEEHPAPLEGLRSFFSKIFKHSTQTNSVSATNDNEERYTEEQIYKCPVCIEPLLETDEDEHKAFATPCQHFFHKDCLAQSSQAQIENWAPPTCPLCRQLLNTAAAPLERAPATDARIRTIEQRHQWELDNLQDQIARLEHERRHDNGNRLPGDNIPHVAPVHHEPENQGGTNITTTKALGLVATGAAAASVIPGASQAIKSGLTAAGTKAYEFACAYPKETAGTVAVAGTGYALTRGTDIRQIGRFIANHTNDLLIIGSGLATLGFISINNQ